MNQHTHFCLGDLLPDLHLQPHVAKVPIAGLAYDSRKVAKDFLFAAWAGAQLDGHDFVAEAIQRGAAAILSERVLDLPPQVAGLMVQNVRTVLAKSAQRFYGDPATQLCMLGVTGTNGKTTMVHLLAAMLEATGKNVGMIGTLGCRYAGKLWPGKLTTPESVDLLALLQQMHQQGTQAVAMEVSSQALAQHRVDGVAYDVGVFHNLTHDHLDYHGTMEAYFSAKARLIQHHLKPHGVAVINVDDQRVRSLLKPGPDFVGYGTHPTATVVLQEAQLTALGMRLVIQTPREQLTVHSPLLGRFNVDNVLATVAVGWALQLDMQQVLAGIAKVHTIHGRMHRVSDAGEPLVLVDYAHTPDALQKALAAARELTPGRLFCVFGCGGNRDPHKRASMGAVALEYADWAVVTNDNPRTENPHSIAQAIEQGLQQSGGFLSESPQPHSYWLELDRQRAIALAIAQATSQDCVLIAGRGHETHQIIGTTSHVFDDLQQARAALTGNPQ